MVPNDEGMHDANYIGREMLVELFHFQPGAIFPRTCTCFRAYWQFDNAHML